MGSVNNAGRCSRMNLSLEIHPLHEQSDSTRADVIEAEDDANLYHLEDGSSNRSHRHEQ